VEGLAQGFQVAADIEEVVDLAVEGDGAPGVAVDHGLGASLAEVQDGEAPVTEHDFLPARLPEAGTVGSTVALRLADPLDATDDLVAVWSRRRLARVGNPADCPGNATHARSRR
jgi:hypothetical protein